MKRRIRRARLAYGARNAQTVAADPVMRCGDRTIRNRFSPSRSLPPGLAALVPQTLGSTAGVDGVGLRSPARTMPVAAGRTRGRMTTSRLSTP